MAAQRDSKHSKILGLKCLDALNDKLANGVSVKEIARWIQEDQLELSDLTRDSLMTTLYRYKKDMPTKQAAKTVERQDPVFMAELKGKISTDFDTLGSLKTLLIDQLDRLAIGRNVEKMTKFMNRQVEGSHMNIRATIIAIHQIEMDLGKHGGRNLGTIGVRPEFIEDVRDMYGEELIDSAKDPKSANKVISIVRRMARLKASGEVFDMESDDLSEP